MISIKYQIRQIKKFRTTFYYKLSLISSARIPNSMINKNVIRANQLLRKLQSSKQGLLLCKGMFSDVKSKGMVQDCSERSLLTQSRIIKNLHVSKQVNKMLTKQLVTSKFSNLRYQFSSQQSPDYNNFTIIRQLNPLSQSSNKFHTSSTPFTFISNQYPIITLDLQKKLQRIESLLHSQQKNLYKIVEETIIVLESFAQTMRRDVMEENIVKVIREFSGKIVSAHLENVQTQELEDSEKRTEKGDSNFVENAIEENDSSYLLHDNYTAPLPELQEKEFNELSGPYNNTIDPSFVFFYIESIKAWLLTRIETDSLIRQAEQQMLSFFNVRQVSALQDTLKSTVELITRNYIEQPSAKKRQVFPFDMKLRGICLLPYFENKKHAEKYMERLADENLFIYLKESQMISLLYDVTELQPNLSELSNFVYQLQSTRVYQNLANMNAAYIKALFINYSRKFMVSYQQIQFYQLFRDIEPRIRYPTIRTFIRLIEILKTQAADLHCEYNKVMNKYNYNIIISILASQSYTIENTKFDEFFELFETLNSLEKSGEILYDEMCKFLKQYVTKEGGSLKQPEIERIYKVFLHVVDQVKPIYKYEQKQGLNKEFSKKTTILLNTLFDILLQKYPHIVLIGNKYVRSYLLSDDNSGSPSFMALPNDDREINIELGASSLVETKLERVKGAFVKVIGGKRSLSGSADDQASVTELLDSMLLFTRINVHLIKNENETAQSHHLFKTPQNMKLLYHLYPSVLGQTVDQSVFTNNVKPLLQEFISLVSKQQFSAPMGLKQLYKNLYKAMELMNSLNLSSKVCGQLSGYLQSIRKNLIGEIKGRVQKREKEDERMRIADVQKLMMSVPKGNVEILLCLGELSKLWSKIDQQSSISKQNHLSSTTIPSTPPSILLSDLPLIYSFLNTIAIQNLKSIQQPQLIPVLSLIKSLEEMKTSQSEKVLLLQLNPAVYEYLYSSMSMFVMYLGDRGKYFLKLSNNNAQALMNVVAHFIATKGIFRSLISKKRLVVLQVILVGLIRKKYIKVGSTHLKRSQHARILLSYLQIFEYPQNLTIDLKKILQEVQFLTSDMEQFSNDILQRFSDINWSITKYLEDNKVGLASSKKLSKLSLQELRKEFQQGSSAKIYQMIIKNSRYQLPFQLPQPKFDDQNTKLAYIIQKIYQKISSKNNYSVTRTTRSPTFGDITARNKKLKRTSPPVQQFLGQVTNGLKTSEELERKQNDTIVEDQERFDEPTTSSQRFQDINLEDEKSYIKRQSLVNYTYQDHYKMSENKLPLHYKKETWKSLLSIPKQLQIESLQIDQKIDENIYKQVLLALLGYVEKVKMVAKEFHSHSFIQYVAAQLDMDVFFHGCIAKITRKNKPEENVLFVCALETNYKLLYICTHILRQSGENAFIITDRTKETDFKDFLEKLLPQPFEADESEIVDKVVKGEISLDGDDSGIIREDM